METVKELKYLFDKKTKRNLFMIFIMIVISSFLELSGITIILPIVNLAMDQEAISENFLANFIQKYTGANTKESILICMIIITVLIYIVKNAFVCFMYSRQFKFAATVKRDMATRLMKAYLKQPYSFFLNKNTSELIRSVNTDTAQLFQLVSNILTVISNALTAMCIIVYLAIENILMTAMVAVVLGICLFIIIFILQKKNLKNGYINQRLNGFLIKHLQQAFEGVKEIKIMNTEQQFIDMYDDAYKNSTAMEVKYSIYNTMPKYLIEVFAIMAILGFLGINIIFNPNYMEVLPQLAVFCVAAYKLLPSVNAIYASYNVVVYHKASVDLVYRDIKEADGFVQSFDDATDAKEFLFTDEIRLNEICFKYDNSENEVLHNANLEIKRGQSVAFIGASGGGKTTTADIILSLLQPQKGTVTVDGVDIQTNIWGWRKKLGYIPQFIYLVDDTIRNNVAFGVKKEDIEDREVWRALEEAQLKEFVECLSEGLDTVVGERGARISGGQRQRIGIARALYRNPEVLVFDEATSALDNETEKEVMKAIDGLQGTKTILMIAHRLSTIENCDVVYKIDHGMIKKDR